MYKLKQYFSILDYVRMFIFTVVPKNQFPKIESNGDDDVDAPINSTPSQPESTQ